MSNKIRSLLQSKIFHNVGIPEITVTPCLSLKFDTTNNSFAYEIPLKSNRHNIEKEAATIVSKKHPECKIINNTVLTEKKRGKFLQINLERNNFIKIILESNSTSVSPPNINDGNRRIVVEFSSPNIAKPFHVGHLRSTIIGNCIANINTYLTKDVTKINYLGDWGTQLGFVILGIELSKLTPNDIKTDPIKKLYSAYVMANKLSENNPNISSKAQAIFSTLENGDEVGLQHWELLKKYTVNEFEKTYRRIGIKFDEYNWESSYNVSKIQGIIETMEKLNLLKLDDEKRKVIAINEKRNLPIIKSDGSTLYITRDIAAAIDRKKRYNFDKMFYVVGNEQTDHFKNLSIILDKMDSSLARRIHHVKFGRIRGMSSRKGTAIFLSDILDEAKDAMREQQSQKSTTKIFNDVDDNSSDVLGISAVIVHDLKQRRAKDYDFNWNIALDSQGESGIRLQYAHCRLINLEKNCGVTLPSECDPSLLCEPIVDELVTLISKFDEAVVYAYEQLEPCALVKYLFQLSHVTNKALGELRVKDEPSDVAGQRLLLFCSARNVLNTGMKLVGLSPLERM